MKHFILLILTVLSCFASSQSMDPRDAYIEASEKLCQQIHITKNKCTPKSNLEKTIFDNLQISCENLRQQNGCDAFEKKQLSSVKNNPNPRAESFERNSIRTRVIGCSADRICHRESSVVSCLRGGTQGIVDSFLAIPHLAIALYEFDKRILDTPAKDLFENIKKELGNKWYCYTPEARLEMMCSLTSFLIPGSGVSGKVIASIKNRFPELSHLKSLQTAGTTEAKLLKPVEITTEEIKRNPQMALWSLSKSNPEKAKALEQQLLETLSSGEIAKYTLKSEGAYRGYILEFKDGTKALWKPDETEEHFLRTNMAGNEKAAYLVDKKLGLDLVPVTTRRDFNGVPGSVQLWVNELDNMPFRDDPLQYGFFDSLISNYDRHSGNVASKNGKQIAIDHGNAFNEKTDIRFFKDPLSASIVRFNSTSSAQEKEIILGQVKNMMPTQEVITKLRSTSNEEWTQLLSKELPPADLKLFLERKDKILEWTSKAEKTFGNKMYPDGPSSPLMRVTDQ